MIYKKNSLFASLFCIFMLFAFTNSAFAEITVEQAQDIQRVFQTKLDQIVEGSGQKVRLDGALLIEPADTYYAVTLPHVFVDLPNGDVADYGIIALNLVPDVDPNIWMVSMALPTEMSTKNKNGDIISKINIGEQNFSGTWNTQMGWFQAVKSNLGNIILSDQATDTTVTVNNITIDSDNETGLDPSRINATGKVIIDTLQADVSKSQGVLNITSVDMTYDISDFEFSITDQIHKMVEQTQSEEFSVPLGPNFGEVETHFVIKDLMWTEADQDNTFKIASMASKGTYAVREEGLMDSDTQINISGISGSGNVSLMEWFPKEFTSHVQINNFPRQAMADWAKEQINIQMKNKETLSSAKITMPPNMEALKASFVNAGTEYSINRFNLKTTIGAGFDIKGQFAATEGAPYVATGKMSLGLTGLDLATAALQKKIAQMAAKPEEGESKSVDFISPMIAQQGLMGIMMVQGFGKTEKTVDGQTVTRFDIEMPRDGGVLINGQDIGALMGMLSVGAPKEQE